MRQRVWHRCEAGCGPWPVSMVKEFGSLFYLDDDDGFCPECGRVGVMMDVSLRDDVIY